MPNATRTILPFRATANSATRETRQHFRSRVTGLSSSAFKVLSLKRKYQQRMSALVTDPDPLASAEFVADVFVLVGDCSRERNRLERRILRDANPSASDLAALVIASMEEMDDLETPEGRLAVCVLKAAGIDAEAHFTQSD